MIVNGEKVDIMTSIDVHSFLVAQGYEPTKVAVELNGSVIKRAHFAEIILNQEDALEIVCFVGGG